MEIKSFVSTSKTGAIVPGAKVYVYKQGTTTLADLYNRAEAKITNPLISDTSGFFEFAAGNGGYDIQFELSDGSKGVLFGIAFSDVAGINTNITALDNQVKAQAIQIQAAKDSADASATKVTQLTTQVSGLDTKVTNMQTDVSKNTSDISSAKTDAADAKSAAATATTNANIANTNTTSLLNSVNGVANITALRARQPTADGERVYLKVHTPSSLAVFRPEGAGWFIGTKTGSATDDGGVVIKAGTGYWTRDKLLQDLTIADFGGVADGVTDAQPAFKLNLDFVVSSYAQARVGNKGFTLPIQFNTGTYFMKPSEYTNYGAKVASGAADAQFNPSGYYAASGIVIKGAPVESGRQIQTTIISDKSTSPVFLVNHRRLTVRDLIWNGQQTVAQDATTKMLVGATKGVFNDTASNTQPFLSNQCPGGCFGKYENIQAINTGSYMFYLLDTLDSTADNIFSSLTAGPVFQIGWSGQTYGAWDHSTSIVFSNCNFSNPMAPAIWAPRTAQAIMRNCWFEHGVCPFDINNGQWDLSMVCVEDCIDNPIVWYTKYTCITKSVPTGNNFDSFSPNSGSWNSYPKNPDGSAITAWTGGYDQGSWVLQNYGAYFNCPVVAKWTRGPIRVTNDTNNTLYLNLGSFRSPTNGGFFRARVLGGIYYNTATAQNMTTDYLQGEATINIGRGAGGTPKISWYSEGQGPISSVQYQTQTTNDIIPAVWVAIRPRVGEVTVFVETAGLHRDEAGIPAEYVPSGVTQAGSPGLNSVTGRFNFNTGSAGFGASGTVAAIATASTAAVNTALTAVATDAQFLNEPVLPNIQRWERISINGQEMAWPVFAWKPVFTTANPATASVVAGATLTLTTVVTDVASQQWQFSSDNGSNWTNISGATAQVLTKTSMAAEDAGQYRLAVRSPNGAGGSGTTTYGGVTTVTVTS